MGGVYEDGEMIRPQIVHLAASRLWNCDTWWEDMGAISDMESQHHDHVAPSSFKFGLQHLHVRMSPNSPVAGLS
jgi:hypothetical protein